MDETPKIEVVAAATIHVTRIDGGVTFMASVASEDDTWRSRLAEAIEEAREEIESWATFDEDVKAGRKPAPWSEEDTTFVPRGTYYIAGQFDWWGGFRRHMRDWLGV